MDIKDLRNTLKICVKQCPNKYMSRVDELGQFYKDTGTNLCRYDFDLTEKRNSNLDVFSSPLGPCPAMPVYNRYFFFVIFST